MPKKQDSKDKKTADKTSSKQSQTKDEGQAQRRVSINAQYVKDLSFENPDAPNSLTGKNGAPNIDVSVDVDVKKLQDKVFEVTLSINSNAKAEKGALFISELSYAGIFTVDVPEQELQSILMIYCPGVLFPFARRVIADTTRDGGFPPLMLEPIDFAALYQQHLAKQQSEGKK